MVDKVRGPYRYQKPGGACVEDWQTNGDGSQGNDSVSVISPSTNRGKARVFEEKRDQRVTRTFQGHDPKRSKNRAEHCHAAINREWAWTNLYKVHQAESN